jgi:hypothetical protein
MMKTRADQQRVSLWKSCRGTNYTRAATRGLMDKRNNRGDSADGKSCCIKPNRPEDAAQATPFSTRQANGGLLRRLRKLPVKEIRP